MATEREAKLSACAVLAVPDLDGKDATVTDLVRAALTDGVDRLLRHDPAVRIGGDVEAVHQARVATRRLRSDLRTFRRLLDPGWNGGLRDELKWAGAELGAVRDADVLGERLGPLIAELLEDQRGGDALLLRLADQRHVAGAALTAAMDSTRYVSLLDRLVDAAEHPKLLPEVAAVPAVEEVPGVVRRPWKHLKGAVASLPADPHPDALHEVRIRAKRLRYALEAVTPVAGRPARQWASSVASLQDVLGDLHDAVVAEAWLRVAVAEGGAGAVELALAAGQLIAAQRLVVATKETAWRGAWKKASSKKRRSAVLP